jgi:hypothetical protein
MVGLPLHGAYATVAGAAVNDQKLLSLRATHLKKVHLLGNQ